MPIEAPSQRMKPPAGDIHLGWRRGLVQGSQLAIEFVGLMRLDARLASSLKKCLKPLVPESFDHL